MFAATSSWGWTLARDATCLTADGTWNPCWSISLASSLSTWADTTCSTITSATGRTSLARGMMRWFAGDGTLPISPGGEILRVRLRKRKMAAGAEFDAGRQANHDQPCL